MQRHLLTVAAFALLGMSAAAVAQDTPSGKGQQPKQQTQKEQVQPNQTPAQQPQSTQPTERSQPAPQQRTQGKDASSVQVTLNREQQVRLSESVTRLRIAPATNVN